jgi:hypothetical protein
MGVFGKLIRSNEPPGESYVERADSLIRHLVEQIPLLDWQNGPPNYTEREIGAINSEFSDFERTAKGVADEYGGREILVHKDYKERVHRMLAEQGLRGLGDEGWKFSDDIPECWGENISAYLKAWMCGLNPMILLDVAELLARAGKISEASEAIAAAQHFPEYARSKGSEGTCSPEIVEQVMKRAAVLQKGIKSKASEALIDDAAREFAELVGPVDSSEIHVNLAPEDNVPLKVFNEVLKKEARRKSN